MSVIKNFKFYIIFAIIVSPFSLASKWQKLETPKQLIPLLKKVDDNFLIGVLDGVYFSFDNGKTWEMRTKNLPTTDTPNQIEIDGDNIFISINNYSNYKNKIYYTKDLGINWEEIKFDSIVENEWKTNSVRFAVYNSGIYLYPAQSSRVFDAFDSNGEYKRDSTGLPIKTIEENNIYFSSNFGETWEEIKYKGMSVNDQFRMINYSRYNDTIIADWYELDSFRLSSRPYENAFVARGIAITTDMGRSWKCKKVRDDYSYFEEYLLTKHKLFVLSTEWIKGIYCSEDLGDTWYKIEEFNNYEVYTGGIFGDYVVFESYNNLFYSKIEDLSSWNSIELPNKLKAIYISSDESYLYITGVGQDINWEHYNYRTNDFKNFEEIGILNERQIFDFSIENQELYLGVYGRSWGIYNTKSFPKTHYKEVYSGSKNNPIKLSMYKNRMISVEPTKEYYKQKLIFSNENGDSLSGRELIIEPIIDYELLNENKILFLTSKDVSYISEDFGKSFKNFESKDSNLNKLVNKSKRIKRIDNRAFLYDSSFICEINETLDNGSIINNFQNQLIDLSVFNEFIFTINKSNNSHIIQRSINNGKNWEDITKNFKEYNYSTPKTIFNVESNVFVSYEEGILFSKDNGESWEELNDGLVDYSGNGKFALFGENILYLSSKGINYQSLSELGINLTSVNNPKIECKNLKEIEYYDVLGNKLLPNQIFNKKILVKYQCLETGKTEYKLEFRER